MEVKAFISHTAKGGICLGETIEEQLIRPPLEIHSFLSKHAIDDGEHIAECILKALIDSDIIFVILEPHVIKNEWVKWEYEFGRMRNIKTICVSYPLFFDKRYQIRWLDPNEQCLRYGGNDGMFRDEIWDKIDDMMVLLKQQADERNKIELNAHAKPTYSEQDTVKVYGNVKGSLKGTAYLHNPYMKKERSHIRSTNVNILTPNDNGDFEFEFKLPRLTVITEYAQKWFIEVRFGKRSQLIPIQIHDTNDGGKKSHNESLGKLQSSKDSAINQEEIKQEINRISNGTLQSIPKTINGQTIKRDDKISKLMAMLEKNDRVIITGEKGSGKSVLLCQLYEKIAKHQTIFFIRCDDYLGIESLERLNQDIVLNHDFIDYVQNIATNTNKLIIIFDSLDAISRNERSMNIFKQFLRNIWGTNRIKTVLSVRTYDYEYSSSIKNTDWGSVYRLELLTKTEADTALAKLGNPAVSSELKTILLNPLHLKLLSLILARSPDANFTNIKSKIELYDEYWDEYVEKLEHADDVRSMLYSIAQRMSSAQRITIPYDDLGDHSTLRVILSRNIFLWNSKRDQISFFHHAYLDYVMSRAILAKHSEFVDFLLDDEYNVFLRPTIVFALSVLHKRDPKQSIMVIEKILRAKLKYFWKISALTALAGIDEPNAQNLDTLGEFLTKETMLQRHFLIEIEEQKNGLWFDLWKNSFFIDWSSSPINPNGLFIIDYLKTTLGRTCDPGSVFRVLQCIVDRNDGWVGRKAIELSAEINIEGKTDWLHKLSTDKSAHVRNGVLKTLPKLIGTNPEAVPDIFYNIYTYVETSNDATRFIAHGALEIKSTKIQDNNVLIWEAESLFPELLKKNPRQMVVTAIKVLETLRKNELSKYNGSVIEDHGYIWFAESTSRRAYGSGKLLGHIVQHLHGCTDKELSELGLLFNSTKLATFRSILIDAQVKRKDKFTNEIFNIISDPQVYEIATLRRSVRSAIKKISPSLAVQQIKKLLDNVMNIRANRGLDEEGIQTRDIIRAQFLSDFPTNVLQPEHQKILDNFSEYDLENRSPYHGGVQVQVRSENTTPAESRPEEVITNNLGKESESEKKIELLMAISEYLDRGTNEIANAKIQPIKKFLTKNMDDPDPKNGETEQDQHAVGSYDTVRGLVAKCTIKLLHHSKDSTLAPLIKDLSVDPINTVRSEVCSELKYLFEYDYDLAYSIAKQYSIDGSIVQFYLLDALQSIVNKHPKHATLIIGNMLDRQARGIEDFLVYLAFDKKELGAIDLLDRVISEESLSPETRRNIPFVLKEYWLFEDRFQDQSLDLLYRLLDDPDNEVRYYAAFFTLNSIEKDNPTTVKIVEKIDRHLNRIVLEIDRVPLDPRLIEELINFLKDFWYLLPKETINYLEKITNAKTEEYTARQPVFAEGSVKIIASLFQHTSLSKENKKRCLNILDTYAMVGWPVALQLLSAMERPD